MLKKIIISLLGLSSILSLLFLWFCSWRLDLYVENKDDDSFFHSTQIKGYARGLDEARFQRSQYNEKDLLILFRDCDIFQYPHIYYEDTIYLITSALHYSLHDANTYAQFSISGKYSQENQDEFEKLQQDFENALDKNIAKRNYNFTSYIESNKNQNNTSYTFTIYSTLIFPLTKENIYEEKGLYEPQNYNKNDIQVGRKLFEYDFKIYQTNIQKKINQYKLYCETSATTLFLSILLLIIYLFKKRLNV